MKNKTCSTSLLPASLCGLALLLAMLWAFTQPAYADPDILYAAPAASGNGECSDWENTCTLQTALARAASGDQIWVEMGVYLPGATRTATFALVDGVEVYGGFAGTETQLDQRNWVANPTVLSGDITGDNCYHVVTGSSGVTDSARLDGFTIASGQASSGSFPNNMGGGMYNDNSSPTLANIVFSGNVAANSGGGMYNRNSSSPTLINVMFNSNSAFTGGGMFSRDGSSTTLIDVTFDGNTADYGGGMYNSNSSPTLTGVTFSHNTVTGAGGGMLNESSSSPMLIDVTFSGNTAAQYGGGMYNSISSSPTLTVVTFGDNSAASGGGMYNNSSSSPVLTQVTFSGNTGVNGGGMFNNTGSNPTLTNVTFSGNTATTDAGGIYNYNSNPTLKNVILWGDSAPTGPEILNSGSNPTIAYSDVQGCGGSGGGWDSALGTDGGGNIDADPLFVDADGPDDTFGTADDNLRLQNSSPAIDAGDNSAVPAGVTTDPDGNPRFVDIPSVPDTGNGTPPIVDMGAYEAQAMPNLAPTITSTPVITATVGVLYTYNVTSQDINGDDVAITAPILPTWLTLADNDDGTAILSGTPANIDLGDNPVTLLATDPGGLTATQTFTITVDTRTYLPLVLR